MIVDGSVSRGCRIFGRLRPVRIVRKRGAMTHQSAGGEVTQIGLHVAVVLSTLDVFRATVGAAAVGMARRALDDTKMIG